MEREEVCSPGRQERCLGTVLVTVLEGILKSEFRYQIVPTTVPEKLEFLQESHCGRKNRLNPGASPRESHLSHSLDHLSYRLAGETQAQIGTVDKDSS